MILDMNIQLKAIDEEFLEELDELIEETRVEYFVINPKTAQELEKTKDICSEYERFKYTIPVELIDKKDTNCVATLISKPEHLDKTKGMALVISSNDLTEEFIKVLNATDIKGVVLEAKQSDNRLENFAYAISYDSLKDWTKKGITDTDYNKLALQSNYPKYDYDHLLDVLLKEMSDLTFRAEQTIAAGGTRTVLKTFSLL